MLLQYLNYSRRLAVGFASMFYLTSTAGIDGDPAPYGPVPSAAQLNWHEMEMYCLIHFTPTTFQNKEWGFGDVSPDLFNPRYFDADQIAQAAKSAGFKGLIAVAKHHDGFCLWPTKTTEYNISRSPWRDGKGDMVKEFEKASRANGLQFGVYVSAWDRNHPEYGNEKYAEAYRDQLRELYSGYGELFTSWHDGANGGDGYYGGANETRRIDRATYYEWEEKTWPITRKMQPSAVIFSDIGPDIRWVGNEKGIAGETCWATITPMGPNGDKPAPGYVDDRYLSTGQRDGKYWIPAECDVPHRPGWFYHPEQDDQVKTPDQLFDLYLNSVGRGAALNLGLAPNRDGRLHSNDVASLKGFGEKLEKTFGSNLAEGALFHASNIRDGNAGRFGPAKLLDADRYSYWATDDDETSPELLVELEGAVTFDLIRLRENIKLGQRLDSVWVDRWDGEVWEPVAEATSIGANRIIALEHPVTVQRFRIRVVAPVAVALSDFGLFKEAGVEYRSVVGARKQLDRSAWKVIINGLQGGDPSLAVDGDPHTLWVTSQLNLPASVTVDLGGIQLLKGFGYLPRQDGEKTGLISGYAFEVSRDGIDWQEVSKGEFSNVVANPILQYVAFDKDVEARYFRFTVKAVANADDSSSRASIAEFELYH